MEMKTAGAMPAAMVAALKAAMGNGKSWYAGTSQERMAMGLASSAGFIISCPACGQESHFLAGNGWGEAVETITCPCGRVMDLVPCLWVPQGTTGDLNPAVPGRFRVYQDEYGDPVAVFQKY